ncbi:glycosyltransferase family 2 protein [Yoonia algicola]|uniref:Glycosyltransferase family 2 protein n=1 Tax=Yoonia algicola TaxID=3137368 RepID=A0AAN0M5P9_9RHOB
MEKLDLISVVTVTLNSDKTILDTLRSVAEQEDIVVEHIIKDGGSSDTTLSLASSQPGSVRILEQTDNGIYDAMNQGFRAAKGDIICFLNSDDYFIDARVLKDVLNAFRDSEAEIVYGDLEIIGNHGDVIRSWRSGEIIKGKLRGQQLPHPSFFVRRSIIEKLDRPFDDSYRIAADFKQQLLLINKLGSTTHYLQRPLVRMRHGGESSQSMSAVMDGWKECMRAYREVTGKSGFVFVISKVARKLRQMHLFNR